MNNYNVCACWKEVKRYDTVQNRRDGDSPLYVSMLIVFLFNNPPDFGGAGNRNYLYIIRRYIWRCGPEEETGQRLVPPQLSQVRQSAHARYWGLEDKS